MDCLFCKIASKQIPSEIVYEDERTIAFNDINPQAPVHVLVIPKAHIEKVCDLTDQNKDLIGDIVMAANKIAAQKNITNSGFRIVLNCNKDAGQAVFHIHAHLLGGRAMNWPPG